MSDNSTLYDDDILLWSEQQATVIRKLQKTARDIPNELDIENVAEEIESVGRSELAAVKSHIRLVFIHLIKLCVEADSQSVSHWRGEVGAFHSEIVGRYAPSMRRRINIDELWRSVREQLMLSYEGVQRQLVGGLSERCPYGLDDLIAERIDLFGLLERLKPQLARQA